MKGLFDFKDRVLKSWNIPLGTQMMDAHTHFCPDSKNCIWTIRKQVLIGKFILGLLIGIGMVLSILFIL